MFNFITRIRQLRAFPLATTFRVTEERKRNIEKPEEDDFDGEIQWTWDEKYQDVTTFEDGTIGLALMPCGHAFQPESLREYCENEFRNGSCEIRCPGKSIKGKCNILIKWSWIIKVCNFTPKEILDFEKQMTDIYLNNSSTLLQCPGCMNWLKKEHNTSCLRIKCPVCSNLNKTFEFCKKCFSRWELCEDGDRDSKICSNLQCSIWNAFETLNNCSQILIFGILCPSVRACPCCGCLIQYKDMCKHIICSKCKVGFCFVCLKVRMGIEWTCDYSKRCNPAPKQNLGIESHEYQKFLNRKKCKMIREDKIIDISHETTFAFFIFGLAVISLDFLVCGYFILKVILGYFSCIFILCIFLNHLN